MALTFNLTIDDTSPQISYLPNELDDPPTLQGGWESCDPVSHCSDSGLNDFLGQLGQWDTLHITGREGASFSINFTGTGILLYGNSTGSSVSLTLDDTPSTNLSDAMLKHPTGVLGSISGLSQSSHTLTLTAHTGNVTDSFVAFDSAVITVSSNSTNATVSTEAIDDTQLKFTGSWMFVNDPYLLPEGNHSYHITQTQGDQAEFTFQGIAVQLEGFLNATAGTYNISLTSGSDPSTVQQFSASSSFLTPTTLFSASGLDPNRTHILTVTNAENRTLAVDGMKITVLDGGVITPSATPTAAVAVRYPSGAIVAIAVAAFLAFVLILCLIAFFIWRRRRKLRRIQRIVAPHQLHTAIGLHDVVDIGPGLTFGHYSQGYEHGDEESESEHGPGQKYDYASDESLEAPAAPPPTRHTSRLASRRHAQASMPARPQSHIHLVSPQPVRVLPPLASLTQEQPADGQMHPTREGDVLSLNRSSPFSLDFDKEQWVSATEGSISVTPESRSNALLVLAKAAGPKNKDRDTFFSFLDIASSRSSSIRAASHTHTRTLSHSRSNSRTESHLSPCSPPSSRRSRTSPARPSLALSIDPGSQSSDPMALNTAQLSPRHSFSFAEAQPQTSTSPTESIPMTVSEINFRVDEDFTAENDERRTSGTRLPPHPPLPSFSSSPDLSPASPAFQIGGHSRSASTLSGNVDYARQPHIAQMLLARRQAHALAQARAQSQASEEGLQSTSGSLRGQESRRPRGLGFINFGRKG